MKGGAPGRIGAILLGCTHAGGKLRVSPSAETVALLMDTKGLSREQIMRQQTPLFFSEKFRTESFKEIEAHYRSLLKAPAQPEYAFQAQVGAVVQFDCTSALSEIGNPILVVTGTEDILIPPANSKFLAGRLPNCELIEIAGAGHCLHVECRDFLNRTVHSFYQKHLSEQGTHD